MPKVTYQYRSPTCLLDVVGTPSQLSKWAERPVLKGVRFQLRFLAEGADHDVTIRGDRAQLDALCLAVDQYIQQTSTDSYGLISSVLATHRGSEQSAGLELTLSNPDKPALDIHLQSAGLFSHNLVLGSLGTKVKPAAQSVLRLSMRQLADLVTVLDDYNAELLALPSLSAQRSFVITATQWQAIAATLVLSVGTIGILARITSSPLLTPISASKSVSISSEISSHLNAPTVWTDPANTEGDRPQPSSRQRSISPSPSPLPPTVTTLPKSSPVEPLLDRLPRQRQTSSVPEPQTVLSPPLPSGANDDSLSSPARPNQPEFISPELRQSITPGTFSGAEMPSTDSTSTILPGQRGASQRSASNSNPDSTHRDVLPPASLPSPLEVPNPVRLPAATPAPAAAPPPTSIGQTASSSGTTSSSGATTTNDVKPQTMASEVHPGRAAILAPSLPQLDELRHYVERNWQPPIGLTEPLRYRLLLNANGSVQSVKPVGPMAWRYRSTLQFPSPDQPLVSPITNRRPLWLWLELKPNGQVLVYEEKSE